MKIEHQQPVIINAVYDVCVINKIYRNKHKRKIIILLNNNM